MKIRIRAAGSSKSGHTWGFYSNSPIEVETARIQLGIAKPVAGLVKPDLSPLPVPAKNSIVTVDQVMVRNYTRKDAEGKFRDASEDGAIGHELMFIVSDVQAPRAAT